MFRFAFQLVLVLVLVLVLGPRAALADEGRGDGPAAPTPSAQPPGFLEQLDRAVCDLVDRTRPSVVQVVIRRTLVTEAGGQIDQVSTSGIVWSADGLIVSLGRAFDNADAIEVGFASGESIAAELVNTDEDTGLALLKVNAAALKAPLQPARPGSAKALRPGSIVLSISNPFGLEGSAALGNIAGLDRVVKRGRMQLTEVLQVSTPVNPGDPGALLANARGELVGVVASTYDRSLFDSDVLGKIYRDFMKLPYAGTPGPFTAQGIGFALPVEQVRAVVERLKAGPLAERGYLGVQVRALEVPAPGGVAIVLVKEGSPAEKAGLRHHDVVVRYDGREVGSMQDFKRLVLDTPVGRPVRIEVLRGDARVSIEAVLERRGKKQ